MDQKLSDLLKQMQSGGIIPGQGMQGPGMPGAGIPGGGMFGVPGGVQNPLKPLKYALSGCFLIPAVLVAIFFAYEPVYNALAPNAIRGQLVDAVYVPDKNGGGKLWFMTDDSFYYTQTVETPGSFSISTESLFNKTYTYVYDPVTKTVLSKTRKDHDSTPPHPKMFYVRDAIWMVTTTITGKSEADIEVIDPESGKQIMNLQSFIDKFPELQSGIAEMNVFDESGEPMRLSIMTRDGQNLYYYLEEDRIFPGISDYEAYARENAPATVTVFVLSGDDPREELYKVVGPADELLGASFSSPHDLSNADTVKFFYDAVATRLTPEQVYLEGIILYHDGDMAVILHQDQVGKNAGRILTGVASDGKILWTLGQDQLFPELKITEEDPFSTTFFMKGKMRADRAGDLLLFRLEEVGIMGIDIKTGEKKWEFRP